MTAYEPCPYGHHMATVEVSGLTKQFGNVLAVDDLSFSLEPGVTGFLGRNGAGKSTTLRMLVGLVRPTAGRALINGVPYADLRAPMQTVGAMLESSGAHPGRTARDHLRAVVTAAGIGSHRVDEVLADVGLTEAAGRRVGGFSLGMRQRLGLATAMLGEPEVLLLDEPANGLDPEGIRWLRDRLRRLGDDGRTVLVSSHVLAEVAQTVDRVVIIDRGRLVADEPLSAIEARVRRGIAVRTHDVERLLDVFAHHGIRAARTAEDEVLAETVDGEAVGRAVASAGVVVYELRLVEGSLEDAFLGLTANATSAANTTREVLQ